MHKSTWNFRNHNLDKFIPLAHIAERMLIEGLSKEFVFTLIPLAFHYEGIFDLMVMWREESDQEFKEEIIADLEDEIDEIGTKAVLPKKYEKYLHFDHLDKISKDVMAFKKSLKAEIERWGGVLKLAKKTGIPQSSLSRFLNTPSLPRRQTLEKIAKAMNLKDTHFFKKWIL